MLKAVTIRAYLNLITFALQDDLDHFQYALVIVDNQYFLLHVVYSLVPLGKNYFLVGGKAKWANILSSSNRFTLDLAEIFYR